MSSPIATAATFAQVWASALPGDVILLSGPFPAMKIKARVFPGSVILDATSAQMQGQWSFSDIQGVTLRGGLWGAIRFGRSTNITVIGAAISAPGLTALMVNIGSAVLVEDCAFWDCGNGAVFQTVNGVTVRRTTFFRMNPGDGVDLASCTHGLIEDCFFHFNHYDGVKHADAIQGWSTPTAITSDIIIRRNRVFGAQVQGITFFSKGMTDGGFDRITLDDNDVCVGQPQGMALYYGRDCVVRDNAVSTWPSAIYRASLNTPDCTNLTRMGNTVAAGAGKPSANDP